MSINDGLVLEAKGITKSFGGVLAINKLDFSLKKGEIHSILGSNGAGKSTLMNVIDGVISADDGDILLNGKHVKIKNPETAANMGIGMVHQELSVLPNISIAENIFMNRLPKSRCGLVKWNELHSKSADILKSVGLDIDPRISLGRLSVADQQMVEIARILSMDMQIILLDEPTSSLSEAEIQRLMDLILCFKSEGRSVVFITHKLDEILNISDRVTILRDGCLVDTVDIVERDMNTEKLLVSMMIGSDKLDISEMFPPKCEEFGEVTIEVKDLSKTGVFKNVSFYAKKGEVIVITGLKGSKRTELIRTVFGADPYTTGKIYIKGKEVTSASIHSSVKNGVAMLTEDRKGDGLVAMMSVKANISLSYIEDCTKACFISKKKVNNKANKFIELLKIKVPSIDAKMHELSGGNQQKVVISKWLAASPDILFLDEPTRGIDINSKYEIYRLIRELSDKGSTIIVVSSEIPEVVGLANRVYVMREGEMVGELECKDMQKDVIVHMMFGHKNLTGNKSQI